MMRSEYSLNDFKERPRLVREEFAFIIAICILYKLKNNSMKKFI